MVAHFCPTSPVSTFSPFAYPLLGISAVTRGNVRVHVKLSDACPFSPDVACIHVFALRLAVLRRFYCNTGQHSCPHQVKRQLPFFARRRPLACFRPALRRFQRFCCNTGQRMCPRRAKRRLPIFARRCPFPCFRPSLSGFQAFPL
jgi:hypothetical protein